MKITINNHKFNINYQILNEELVIEGFLIKDGKYISLKFSKGNECLSDNLVKSKIVAINDKIKIQNTEIQELNINDFIEANIETETIIRLEKNGVGPYQSENPSKRLSDLFDFHRNNFSNKRHQPTYFEDFRLISIRKDLKFAFANYSQLFNWFTLSEVQLILNEGFKLVHLQKGRDYGDSLSSRRQVVYCLSDNINKVING